MLIQLDPGAKMPIRAHEHDAGLDLYAMRGATIAPHSFETIDTGVHMAIPHGFVGLLTSKSGLMAKSGLTCRGTIDPDYTGSIQAVIFNHSNQPVRIEAGQKVTQIVIMPVWYPDLVRVGKLPEAERGDNGFGSTGK